MTPGIAFGLLDGREAAEREADLLALAAQAGGQESSSQELGGPEGGTAGAEAATRRARVRRRQPGFALAEARHGGYLVGYAAGLPLRPSTSWWRGLTTPLPGDFTTEHPGRTFAVAELVVRASWRRQGIGRDLHDLLLSERREERAALTVAPGPSAAQHALQAWGWRKVGRGRDDWDEEGPVLDVMVLDRPGRS